MKRKFWIFELYVFKIFDLILTFPSPIFRNRQMPFAIFIFCLIGMIVVNVIVDYLFTQLQNSAFYFSESLLFSSYWILYLPLLPLLLKVIKLIEKIELKLFTTSSFILLHSIIYPALVWLLSEMFFNHTFDYLQTFNFGLSAYFIKSVIIYGSSSIAFNIIIKHGSLSEKNIDIKEKINHYNFFTSIMVIENNKTSVLAVKDIFYFSANSPYINIHHLSKRYIHTETLKSLEKQLDEKQFVRIHKSHIVNLEKISSYQSRQNGDYDVSLLNGAILRVSRNYAKDFKLKFEKFTHLTTK